MAIAGERLAYIAREKFLLISLMLMNFDDISRLNYGTYIYISVVYTVYLCILHTQCTVYIRTCLVVRVIIKVVGIGQGPNVSP